jgi:V-type H+-transporting ATPase subunit E
LQEEKQKLKKEFEVKMKSVDVKRRITQSNEINAARLRVLSEREAAVVSVLERAQERLGELSKDKAAYKALLTDLIGKNTAVSPWRLFSINQSMTQQKIYK